MTQAIQGALLVLEAGWLELGPRAEQLGQAFCLVSGGLRWSLHVGISSLCLYTVPPPHVCPCPCTPLVGTLMMLDLDPPPPELIFTLSSAKTLFLSKECHAQGAWGSEDPHHFEGP